MADLFTAKDYRQYLKTALELPRYGRGAKGTFARALGIQPSFLSSVLGGKQDLTLEHGLRAAEFLALTEEESDYFLLLLQLERAGTHELRRYFQKQIDEIHRRRGPLKQRISGGLSLETAEHLDYFSSWRHPTVLMAVRNPKCRDLDFLVHSLGLSREEARESIDLLVRLGLVTARNHGWEPTERRLHLEKNSIGTRLSHLQWRSAAIRSLDHPQPEDFHYSVVMSIDSDRARRLRALLIELVEASEPLIREAGDEEVQALSLDLYRLSRK